MIKKDIYAPIFLFIVMAVVFVVGYSVCFGAASDMYVTAAGAGGKSGVNWSDAFGLAEFETDAEGGSEAGDTYYIAGGTYSWTDRIKAETRHGTILAPISFIGVKSGTTAEPPVAADWAYGADRPHFDGDAEYFQFGNYIKFFNIRITVTSAYTGVVVSGLSNIFNVSVIGTTCTVGGINLASYGVVSYSSSKCTNSTAFALSNVSGNHLYAYDSVTGMTLAGRGTLINSAIDTCTTGVTLAVSDANYRLNISGNTFYGSTTCLSLTGTFTNIFPIFNNIFDNCTTGISAANDMTGSPAAIDYNLYSNNTADVTNVDKGANSVTSDITFTDAPGQDFTLPDSSVAEGAGMQVDTNINIVGDYNWNIGVDQTDTQAGGGGSVTVGYSN